MACGRLALERAGIPVTNYFASEIDKHAIQVAKANWPDIQHIGDVTQVKGSDLPQIDLLIGGSPCQGFSFAGKQLNFDDPRSKLFFEFVRLYDECMPTHFLLENVRMKKEYQDTITRYMCGIEPIAINSALVSAQMRQRYYWTNIPNVSKPKGIDVKLADIVTDGYVEKKKSWCMLESWNRFPKKKESAKKRYSRSMMPIVFTSPDFDWEKGWRPLNRIEGERLQTLTDGYTSVVDEKTALGLMGNGWTVDVIAHILKNIPHQDIY